MHTSTDTSPLTELHSCTARFFWASEVPRDGGYYFPLAVLFKTPLATLVAILAAVVLALVLRLKPDAWTSVCFLLPILLMARSR